MSHRIALWSGPRNVSTALMYSFAQRADTVVVDEPLYAHYLRVSGAQHPGRDDVLESMDQDGLRVADALVHDALTKPVLFMKHMAHHLVDLGELDFLDAFTNVLLVRDPEDMLPSLTIQMPDAGLVDTGLARQVQLLDELRGRGQSPVVLDSRELLRDPEGVLRTMCERLGIDFDPAMLNWTAGARPEDGIWAKHWYHAVHRSTGFARYRPKPEFPSALQPLLDECRPYYDQLFEHAIKAGSGGTD